MSQRPIAIIGISCRLPDAEGPESFWKNILESRDCVSAVPAERWDRDRLDSELEKAGIEHRAQAGATTAADCYDAAFFGIKDNEAQRIDPQQGIVLEAAWHACEEAGIIPDSLAGKDVGVFIGVSTRDFDRRAAGTWHMLNIQSASGSCGAIVANRLSYTLGLTGPSVAVDTACASSLTAIHQACRALDDSECDMAFAGGVQLILSPTNIIAFSRDGALAKSGNCKPFSKDADGYVFGEGVGMLLLKPLDAALRDGDRIRAVIRGSAINHNGRSNGLSAPYGAALQKVMHKALACAGMAASTVDYIEAHAVGTPIGDAIEMQAIRNVYGTNRDPLHPCHVGSVKGNIGHLEAASGVAALIKAVLALEHGMLPPSLNCHPPSVLLRLDPASVRVCESAQPWSPLDRPRRAGISAFGFGGANAHVIVEQAPPANETATHGAPTGPWLLMISARSAAAFTQLCERYREYLVAEMARRAPLDKLRDFCRATALDRQHHPLRRALLVSGWADAITGLEKAVPAAAAKHCCRIGIFLAEWACSVNDQHASSDNALIRASSSEHWQALHSLLKQLGIHRLYIKPDTDAAKIALLASYAGQGGISACTYNEKSPPFSDCLIIVEAEDENENPDLVWHSENPEAAQYTRLIAMLYERGFSLDQGTMESLFPGARYSLPLYPFERRRNYLLLDSLSHERIGENRTSLPA